MKIRKDPNKKAWRTRVEDKSDKRREAKAGKVKHKKREQENNHA